MSSPASTDRVWYFVRHGETDWNAEKRMQGQWNSRLSENGKRHADVNGRWLATLGIEHVWASPLGRVKETAQIIADHLPLAGTPDWDDRLMEWSSGDWSGELYADIRVKRPEEWAAWTADRYNFRPPNGENFVDLEVRSDSFIADTADHPARTVAVLAHGFIIRVMVGRIEDHPLAPAQLQTGLSDRGRRCPLPEGDPERRRRAHVAEHGISLDEAIRDQLVLISNELGVAVPSAAL